MKRIRDELGRFVKGSPGFNRKHTKESIEKMSLIKLGKHMSPESEFKKGHISKSSFPKGFTPWNKGTKGMCKPNRGSFAYINGKGYRHWIFDRYGKFCWRCFNIFPERKLQVHHVDRDKENNNENNLAILCRKCHLELHGRKAKCKI